MSDTLVDKIADAILYEGYILYPYRGSSQKNRERFTFGRVYPRAYSEEQKGAEAWVMQTQCVARLAGGAPSFQGRVRFLHPMAREVCEAYPSGEPGRVVPELRFNGRLLQTWHEAVEREVAIPEIPMDPATRWNIPFAFPASESIETLQDDEGRVQGHVRRRQHEIEGELEIAVERIEPEMAMIAVRILNRTPLPGTEVGEQETVLLSTLASAHTILVAKEAEFISLLDPPPDGALAATSCENIGTWPVLVGDKEKMERDTILSSPIILYDYPQIAPESPGALCDGLEIDEILTLRVRAMTDSEKSEMSSVDEFARRILERTESLGEEDLMKMHGTLREVQFPGGDFFDENTRLDSVSISGVRLHEGDRVRINPKGRADAMDLVLAGKIGVIEAIEQDAEDRVHLALVLDDDPGRDLGMMRQPGHRFFYTPEEVEPVEEGEG